MQGMIVLNEYVMDTSRMNPWFIIFAVVGLTACALYWIVRESNPGLSTALTIAQVIFALALCCTPKHLDVGERRVMEVYLDARASIPRITETYDIIEQRGKIYVLAEKETVENK